MELALLHRNEAQLQPTARKVREHSATSRVRPSLLHAHHHCPEAAAAQLGSGASHPFVLEQDMAEYLGSNLANLACYSALSNEAAADQVDPERLRQV